MRSIDRRMQLVVIDEQAGLVSLHGSLGSTVERKHFVEVIQDWNPNAGSICNYVL